jgi:hypothetical protein
MLNKLLFCISGLLLTSSLLAQGGTTNPQSKIETLITDCISLLENKEYKTLITKYADPEDLKDILKDKSLDELVKKFAENKAERMLKALKIAKEKEIEYQENSTIGIIKLGEVESGPDHFTFKKIDGLWYIAD